MITNHVTSFIILNLITLNPDYPWYRYIAHSQQQFELVLPVILKESPSPKAIEIHIDTHDETLTISEQIAIPNFEPNLTDTMDGISYNFYWWD